MRIGGGWQLPGCPAAAGGDAGGGIKWLLGSAGDVGMGDGLGAIKISEPGKAAEVMAAGALGEFAFDGGQPVVRLYQQIDLIATLVAPIPESGCRLIAQEEGGKAGVREIELGEFCQAFSVGFVIRFEVKKLVVPVSLGLVGTTTGNEAAT